MRAGFDDQAAFDRIYGAEPPVSQLEQWDLNREMTFRIAWKPYMYNPTLPHLLGGVQAPALVVWGRQDRVVPLECGERYAKALPQRPARRRRGRRALRRDGAARRGRQARSPSSPRRRNEETSPCTSCTSPSSRCRRIPRHAGRDFGATALMFSNKHFDPVAGSRLYNQYIEHYKLAEEVGFDGIMLNEHHNAPFCMQAKCNVFASILAAITERVKIVLLGNPLPLADNPVRLAEELAMIDMVSKGRLVSGFVRGGGQEQLATGVNPAFNRERFEEAHDLIVRAWTQPGPFRWEGTHYQHRVVNPWAVPLQKPHPRIWIPGVLSQGDDHLGGEAAVSVHRAQHGDRRHEEDLGAVRLGGRGGGLHGRPREPRVPAALPRGRDRGEGARQRAAVHVDAGRVHRPRPPGVVEPVGLLLAVEPPAFVEFAVGRRGNPRAARVRGSAPRPADHRGHAQDRAPQVPPAPRGDAAVHRRASGRPTASCRTRTRKTCIRLLGQEVLPAVREMGKELGLLSPFEANAPVSIKYGDNGAGPVAEPAAAAAAGAVKLGICIPHYGRAIEVGRLLEVVRHAEARGLDSVWVTDHVIVPRDTHVIYRHDMLDPLAILPWLAGVTERIALGTSVVILPYRSPIPVAKLLASVDVLSGGRLIVGVAIGWLEGEFDALNVPFKERASRTDEALELFRALWTRGAAGADHTAPSARERSRSRRCPCRSPGRRSGSGAIARGVPARGAARRRLARELHGPRGLQGRERTACCAPGKRRTRGRARLVSAHPDLARRDPSRRGRHEPASRTAHAGRIAAQVAEELRGFEALGVSHVALEVSYSTYPAILETIDLIADKIRPALSSRIDTAH